MEKPDRRDRIRKKAVDEALVELLKKKPISEITIVELTERADINRKTFYNHYADIYAVVGEIEDEIVEELCRLLRQNLPEEVQEHSMTAAQMEKLAAEMAGPFFTTLIQALKDNDYYTVILKNCEGHCQIQRKIAEMEKKIILQYLKNDAEGLEQLDYYVTFLVEGAAAVINRWSEGGFETPVDELAGFFGRLVAAQKQWTN